MNVKAFWFLLALLPLTLQSQTYRYNTSNHELVYVHLDKLIYVAGELVHYKAYLADAKTPGGMPCSKILYFTLSGGQEPITWRINIKNNTVAGSFVLPENLKEGMYSLTAYTNWMRNGPSETYYRQELLIVSLSKESSGYIRMFPEKQKRKVRVDAVSGSTLKVTMPKNTYKPGEMVEAEISFPEGTGINADISVSVTPDHPFNDYMEKRHITDVMSLMNSDSSVNPKNIKTCDFPIEDRGLILSGRVIKSQGSDTIKPCNVWLSVADSVASGILNAVTDSTGHFRFYLGKRYDNKELIIQLADADQCANCRLEIFSKSVISDTGKVTYPLDSTQFKVLLSVADSLSSKLLNVVTDSTGHFRFYLAKMYGNKELIVQLDGRLEVFSKSVISDTVKVTHSLDSTQFAFLNTVKDIRMIEAIYGTSTQNAGPPVDMRYLNFLGKPDKVIFPSEFSEMRNFKEVAGNIIPEARFSVRNDKFHLWVLSPSDTWKESKIVMLNGVPFSDLAYISTLGTKDISRIETYKSNLLVGDYTLQGLLCIYTYDLKIPENYLKSRTVRFNNSVLDVPEVYSEQEQITYDKHFPQFKNNLYWNPFVKVTGGRASISFPSMLLQGQFVVQIEGITDKGIPVNASASFEIKE